jgi:hypothetical protein
LKAYYNFFYSENEAYNEENFKPKQRFYYSKLTWYNQQTNKLPDNISDHDASVVTIQCSKNIFRSSKKNIPIPNVAEKNILILVEEKK